MCRVQAIVLAAVGQAALYLTHLVARRLRTAAGLIRQLDGEPIDGDFVEIAPPKMPTAAESRAMPVDLKTIRSIPPGK